MLKVNLQLLAHKMGVGSENGRDLKQSAWEPSAATISFGRQYPGASAGPKFIRHHVGRGKDDTLFAMVDGTVRFERKGKDKKKSVFIRLLN